MCAALSHVCRRGCQPATGPTRAPGNEQSPAPREGRALHDTAPVGDPLAGWVRRCFTARLNPREGAALGSAAVLCPVGRRRAEVPSRFLPCLYHISSGQVASLNPNSSRARKAKNRSVGLGNYRRAVPPCAEKTHQRVSTCPGEGAEGHTGTPGRPERLSRI